MHRSLAFHCSFDFVLVPANVCLRCGDSCNTLKRSWSPARHKPTRPALACTAGHKSLRSPACVALNAFLAQALNCLGMTLLHMSLMVVFVMGMESAFGFRSRPATLLGMFEPLSVPFAHLAVALVTVASLQDGGCRGAIPVVVIAGVASVAWATVVARRRLARGALGARGDDLSAVVQLTGSQVPSAPVQ